MNLKSLPSLVRTRSLIPTSWNLIKWINTPTPTPTPTPTSTSKDWDDSQTDLAHLGGVAPGAAKSAGDKLWEDNWDDDDIEDDFSVQLR